MNTTSSKFSVFPWKNSALTLGNRTSLAADLIVGSTTTKDFVNNYWFDSLNRMTRVEQKAQTGGNIHAVAQKRVDVSYNKLGQITAINRFESLDTEDQPALRTAYTYDAANRLQEIAHRNISASGSPNLLSRYQYTYDAMNRITSINSSLDGVSAFNYDQRSQLVAADHAPQRPDENYSYDNNGNRNMAGYTTGSNNQTTADGTYTYLYDNEGNRTRRTKVSDGSYEDYTWDHRNRLTKVTFYSVSIGFMGGPEQGANTEGGQSQGSFNFGPSISKTVDYTYDVFNRLIKRVYDSNGPAPGGQQTLFFAGFDGINPTLAFKGGSVSDLSNRFLWGAIVDQLFADEQITNPLIEGNIVWPLGDHLGTLRDLADFDGTSYSVANHRVYDSFGKLTSETNSAVDTFFAYTGKYFDRITGLSNHWHRWYDPQLGKWISEDPIGFLGGDANLLRYVGNSPKNLKDSTGLIQEDDLVLVKPFNPLFNTGMCYSCGTQPSTDIGQLDLGLSWNSFYPSKPSSAGVYVGIRQFGGKHFIGAIGYEILYDWQLTNLAH
ncbi:MAG: hypothetical protein KF851_07350 [Pirellulaceae bacterium]|nr:hypothetical protein [Pirellulaceae bacterium]